MGEVRHLIREEFPIRLPILAFPQSPAYVPAWIVFCFDPGSCLRQHPCLERVAFGNAIGSVPLAPAARAETCVERVALSIIELPASCD